MNIEFLDIAYIELEEAIFFYELEQDGLGGRFKEEFQHTIERIQRFPDAWPIERGDIRKCFVHKFPYKILYALEEICLSFWRLLISIEDRITGSTVSEKTLSRCKR